MYIRDINSIIFTYLSIPKYVSVFVFVTHLNLGHPDIN